MHFVFPFPSDDYTCMVDLIIGKIIIYNATDAISSSKRIFFSSPSGRQSYKIKLHYTQHLN